MADYQEYDERGELSRAGLVGALLDYGGWLVIISSVVWGIYGIYQTSQSAAPAQVGGSAPSSTGAALSTLVLMFCGIMGGVALWAIAELMRRAVEIQLVSEQTAATQRELLRRRPGLASGPVSVGDSQPNEELTSLLREVRDISLLNEEQRGLRLKAQGEAALAMLQREVPVLLREHNWIEARNRVQEARERFPSFTQWDALERQIEQMRTQVEAHDIDAAERQIKDLVSLQAWDRVAEVVAELLERHPDSTRAHDLAEQIRAQRHSAEAEARARLMSTAQEATNAREWRAAATAATELIQRYPKSPEAQSLRMQLPVLRENAEIQTRKQMESQIQEHVREHRYAEALDIAHELLQQYPNSPQATALREQLPRLEEMSAAAGTRR